jgi:hypothetical protein
LTIAAQIPVVRRKSVAEANRNAGDRYTKLTTGPINFSIAEVRPEGKKTGGLTVPEELFHDLGEVCQGNDIFVSIHELKDVVEFDVIQMAAVEVEDTVLQLFPGNKARFLCVILVEDLRNRHLVPSGHRECHFWN